MLTADRHIQGRSEGGANHVRTNFVISVSRKRTPCPYSTFSLTYFAKSQCGLWDVPVPLIRDFAKSLKYLFFLEWFWFGRRRTLIDRDILQKQMLKSVSFINTAHLIKPTFSPVRSECLLTSPKGASLHLKTEIIHCIWKMNFTHLHSVFPHKRFCRMQGYNYSTQLRYHRNK